MSPRAALCRQFPGPLYHADVAENAGSGSSERPPGRASGRPGPSAALAAERVAGIIAAAEETAERMRLETEERVRGAYRGGAAGGGQSGPRRRGGGV